MAIILRAIPDRSLRSWSVRLVLALLLWGAVVFPLAAEDWRPLAQGLELREFLTPDQTRAGDDDQDKLAVLRFDPAYFSLKLGSALESGKTMTVREWAQYLGCVATINAGMFRADDRLRSTGHLRSGDLVVNPYIHPDYGAFLLFDPKDPALPVWRWVDRKLDADWQEALEQYGGAIQNFRLISRERQNLWTQDYPRHSAAAIGLDQAGRLVFIHCRASVSMHEFAQALLDLPLDLVGAMYVEGGADAAMFVETADFLGRWVGEYRSDFFQGSNRHFWPTPNVLGVCPK